MKYITTSYSHPVLVLSILGRNDRVAPARGRYEGKREIEGNGSRYGCRETSTNEVDVLDSSSVPLRSVSEAPPIKVRKLFLIPIVEGKTNAIQ